MNRSLTGIIFERKLAPLLLIFTIFQHMSLTTVSDDSNPLINKWQLMVPKILMFHENTDIFPYGDSYDISRGNNYPI